MKEELPQSDLFQLESSFWIAERKTQVALYDFAFSPLFQIARPWHKASGTLVARIGAIADYEQLYHQYLEHGLSLVNTPKQHQLASELEYWYPLVADLSPRSKVYETFPSAHNVKADFEYPVFIKGNRQTAKHNPELSIARNDKELEWIAKAYTENSILHWQKVVVREFVDLKPLEVQVPGKMKLSLEFRTFWWKGVCVGHGSYWSQYAQYACTPTEKEEGLKLAKKAVNVLKVPFIVIDLALNVKGEWILIECNDGQESGYCGVDKAKLWRQVLALEERSPSRQ